MVLVYENKSESRATFQIGNAPGDPPTEYDVEPGARCEGPAGYVKIFARHGLVPVADEPAAPADPPGAGEPTAPTIPPTEGEVPPPAAAAEESATPAPRKRGGR